MIYVGIYIALCLLMLIANRTSGARNGKTVTFMLLSVIVLVLSLMAALRDISVGTDTSMYVNRFVTISKMSNPIDAFLFYGDEPGYILANFIVGRVTSNAHVFFFFVALLSNFLIVKVLYDNRNRFNMAFGFLVYLAVFYQLSFNYFRQSLAMAVFFYTLRFFPEKKFKKVLIFTVLAMLFHYSGIMILILYGLYRLFNSKYRKLAYILVYGGLIVFFVYFKEILVLLVHLIPPLNKPKYLLYVEGAAGYSIGYLNLLVKAPIALILALFMKDLKKRDGFNPFLIQLVMLDLVLSQIGQIAPQSHRISLYAEYAKMLIIPQLAGIFNQRAYRLFVNGVVILYLVVFWYIFFIYKNYNHTYPYFISLTY